MKKKWGAKKALLRFAKSIDLPEEITMSGSHVEIIGQSNVVIENTKGILKYEDAHIKISLGKKNISVFGQNLVMKNFIDQTIIVSGKISGIEFGG